MKTIKQIAKELNVSKQAVYKRYKGKLYTEVSPYTHTDNGTLYIDEEGESIIKADFLKDKPGKERIQGADTERIQGYSGVDTEYIPNIQVLETLNKTIELLQEQLKVKDKQIEELHNIIDRNQMLQAGTIKSLTEGGAEQKEEITETAPGGEDQKPKKRFFFFRRK